MAGIFVEIVGNASQFKRELDSAVASTAKANSGFHKMGRAAGVLGLALGGALAIGLTHAAKGAMEDEVANERLKKSFENAHQPISQFTKRIDEATKAGINLGFHDEQVAETLGSLEAATHSGAAALKLLASVEDVARFKHVDMAAAAKMVTSTLSGNVRAAKALGIQLIPVTTNVEALRAKYKALGEVIPATELLTAKYADKQATAELAVRKLNAAIGGTAEAFAKTSQGQIDVLNAKTDTLSDSLGKHLIPAIKGVVDGLNTFVGFMAEHTTLTYAFVIALSALSAALLAVSAAAFIADAALSPILIPVAAAVVAIGVLSFVVYKLVQDFRANWPLLLPIVLGPLGAIIAAVIHWHSQITGAFAAAWNQVKSVTTAGINAVLGAVRGAIGAAGAAASAVGHAIVSGIMSVLGTIGGKVKQGLHAIATAISGVASAAFGWATHIGSQIVQGVLAGLTSLPGQLASKLHGMVSSAIHAAGSLFHGSGEWMATKHLVGLPLVQGIIDGIKEGTPQLIATVIDLSNGLSAAFARVGPHKMFTEPAKAAKRNFDQWAASDGVDNFAGMGRAMGRSLSDGVTSGLVRTGESAVGLVTPLRPSFPVAASTSVAAGQIGIGGGNPTASPRSTAPTNIHVEVGGKELFSLLQQEDGRYIKRNGRSAFGT